MNLVHTKLHPPDTVTATCLRARLIPARQIALTVIHAPTGFGKTTLALQIIRDAALGGWLSIDPFDNHPQRFWLAVVAALRVAHPSLGKRSEVLLRESDTGVWDALACLLNDLNELDPERPSPLQLTWDDFHHVSSHELLKSINFFIDHLPAHWRLIVTSRHLPALKLAQRKSKGFATEITAHDLRFTEAESIEFLARAEPASLARDFAAIHARCEGWAAALRLYSLSGLTCSNDTPSSAAEQDIHEVLFTEVMAELPEGLRHFLGHTAFLPRFCPALVNHLLGEGQAEQWIPELISRNLFVVAPDGQQQWLRYHDLFKELILQVQAPPPDTLLGLRAHAAAWFEFTHHMAEALEQHVLARQWAQACRLLATVGSRWIRQGHGESVRRLLGEVPHHEWQKDPALLCLRFWVASDTEKFTHGETWLDRASDLIEQGETGSTPTESLTCEVMTLKAIVARLKGQWLKTLAFSQAALEAAESSDSPLRWRSFLTLGAYAYLQGELARAASLLEQAVHWALVDENLYGAAQSCGYLSEVLYQQGELQKAWQVARRVESELASRGWDAGSRLGSWRWIGLVDLFREQGDFAQAEGALAELRRFRQLEKCEALQHLIILIRGYTLSISQGQAEQALGLIQQIEDVQQRMHFKSVFASGSMAALRAEAAWLRRDAPACRQWLVKHARSSEEPLSFIDERDELIAIRILVLLQRPEEAAIRAARLVEHAATHGHTVTHALALTWSAIALHGLNDLACARSQLICAFELVSGEGYRRLLLDQGRDLAPVLDIAKDHPLYGAFCQELLAAMVEQSPRDVGAAAPIATPQPSIETSIDIGNNLSRREVGILWYVRDGYSDKEIARLANISPGTVKTHLRNIYRKLEVNGRVQALSKMNLLSLNGNPMPTH
ncbi:hypothetical protein GTZ97_00205 [Aquabacterium fontiphilum]|uniref:LuxR C-terminal-related transcriptional regulator n=1 Tax=Aquabacterium fontiphilum TaxID=450365 RepID=UPI0013769535|nr:LuxR C-terminal-related transcriptional regulator [Aquabacterium fontiphilum]NBD19091.1 hypothetical protein [Aquabacterium fontiphilum]